MGSDGGSAGAPKDIGAWRIGSNDPIRGRRCDDGELGLAVRAARKQQGLDQLLLADLAGVSDRFLRDLEHGKPTVQLREVLLVLDAPGLTLQVQPR